MKCQISKAMLFQFSFAVILFHRVKSCPAGLPKEDPSIELFPYQPNGPGPIPYRYTQGPPYFQPPTKYPSEPQSKNFKLISVPNTFSNLYDSLFISNT